MFRHIKHNSMLETGTVSRTEFRNVSLSPKVTDLSLRIRLLLRSLTVDSKWCTALFVCKGLNISGYLTIKPFHFLD